MKTITSRALWVIVSVALFLQYSLAGASEFIENMPKLAKDTDRPGAMIWQKPGVNRAAYTRVLIEPLTIFISPDSEYKGLDGDDLKDLADGYQEALTKALEPDVPVVNKGGQGVLYIRAALTNVKITKGKFRLLNVTPIGLARRAAKGPTVNLSLKDAVLEIETLDAVTGERIGVLVDKAPKMEKELSWDAIEKTLAFYAERFKMRLKAAK